MPGRSRFENARRLKNRERPDVDCRAQTATRETPGRVLLFVCSVLLAYPVRSYPITAGLDASWAFALNFAHDKGLIFGRDAIFTYGPLAWLAIPMDVGDNLRQALVFQIACWVAFAGIIAWLTFVRRIELWRMAMFTMCLLAGWRSFHHWDYVGPEMFVAFLGLLLLGGALKEEGWLAFFMLTWLLGLVLLFVKFTAGIMIVSAAALFAGAVSARDRRKALHFGIAAILSTGILATAGCTLYFTSLSGLLRYARAGLAVSSGYSAAMSVPGTAAPLVMALALIVSWLLLTAVLFRNHDRALPLAVAFLAPWFLLFKHSFVREPLHAGMIFAFAPLLWGVVVLFSEIGREDLPRLAPALALFVAVMALTVAPASSPTRLSLAADRLPGPITAAIGSEPVAIFPQEFAYAAANRLNLRPFPVLQAYSAYTSYLDQIDAAFLNNAASSPDLVLFDWQSIDGRHPLLDVPATAIALYRHYEAWQSVGGHLLLRRRKSPRFGEPHLVGTFDWTVKRPFLIPESRHPLLARIHLEMTAEGKLYNFLFRLPEITLMDFRVPPEVLKDGVPLNFLPMNLEDAQVLFSDGVVPRHESNLCLAGAGLRFFHETVKVELLEISEVER